MSGIDDARDAFMLEAQRGGAFPSRARAGVLALLVLAVAPSAAEDLPPEEMPTPLPVSRRLDANQAPLPLLAAVGGIGRSGARRIGEARAIRPFEREEEIGALLSVPPALVPFGVGLRRRETLLAAVRVRAEGTVAGWRLLESAEARGLGVSLAAAVERDPGERSLDDFAAWSISREARGGRLRVVAGDLAVRLGSGLLVGTGSSLGAPSDFGPPEGSRLTGYRSVSESGAHRGVGIRLARSSGALFFLLTSTKRDARVDEEGRVSSIDESGLHRNDAEIEKKDRLRERIAAFRWEGRIGAFRAGWTAAGALFDPPLGGGDDKREAKAFRGRALAASSLDGELQAGKASLAVEIGRSSSGGSGGRLYLRRPIGRARALLLFRNFSGRFHAPRSSVYHRIGGEPSGEIGLLALLSSPLGKRVSLFARGHRYASFDRTFTSEGRVHGAEGSLSGEATLGSLLLGCDLAAAERSEVRGERRVLGASRSLGAEAVFEKGGWKLRLEVSGGSARSPGSTRVKQGSGLSCFLSFRRSEDQTIALSYTRLFREERAVAFPVPSLPGAFPFAFFGGGREESGVRLAWKGILARPWRASVAVGPGRVGFEIGLGAAP